MIEVNGFTYYLVTKSKTLKKNWRCSTHSHKGCAAFVYTIDDNLIALNEKHSHLKSNKRFSIVFEPKIIQVLGGNKTLVL